MEGARPELCRRVLLVEDESDHALLIRRAFARERSETQVDVATTLAEARQRIAEQPPDIVFIDLQLPDGSGLELLAEPPETRGWPAVVLTSHGNESVAVQAMRAGASDYLTKSAALLADAPRVVERTLREWAHIRERRRLEAQLVRAQKLEAVGSLADSITHDLNNMLTVIMSSVELIRDAVERDPIDQTLLRQDLDEIELTAQRGAALTRQLLTFSRRQPDRPATLWPNERILALHSFLGRVIRDDAVLDYELDERAPALLADPAVFDQLVLDLTLIVAAEVRRSDRVALRTQALPDAAGVVLSATREIAGDAQPMHDGSSERVRLGLSAVELTAELCGATLEVDGAPAPARVAVRFDATAAPRQAPERLEIPEGRTVLLCQRDPSLRRLMARTLESEPYQLLVAETADEALRLAEGHEGEIHLLVAELLQEDMGGPALAAALQEHRTELEPLFVCSLDASSAELSALHDRLLLQPYGPGQLRARVARALTSA